GAVRANDSGSPNSRRIRLPGRPPGLTEVDGAGRPTDPSRAAASADSKRTRWRHAALSASACRSSWVTFTSSSAILESSTSSLLQLLRTAFKIAADADKYWQEIWPVLWISAKR